MRERVTGLTLGVYSLCEEQLLCRRPIVQPEKQRTYLHTHFWRKQKKKEKAKREILDNFQMLEYTFLYNHQKWTSFLTYMN